MLIIQPNSHQNTIKSEYKVKVQSFSTLLSKQEEQEQEQAMVLSVVRLIDGGRVRDMEREWNGVQGWATAMCLRLGNFV